MSVPAGYRAAGYRWQRPRLLPFVVVACAVATLIALGSWQLHRLRWKDRLTAEIAQASTGAPVDLLPQDPAQIKALAFRRVLLHGEFLNAQEFHLASRYRNDVLGYHILTPFRLDDGRVVLLNRGWVPFQKKLPAARPGSETDGPVSLVARIRNDSDRNTFTPQGVPAKNLWFWKDIDGMKRASGLPIEPYSLDVMEAPATASGLPIALSPEITLRNDHLGYAITWYALALGAAVIFAMLHLKPKPAP